MLFRQRHIRPFQILPTLAIGMIVPEGSCMNIKKRIAFVVLIIFTLSGATCRPKTADKLGDYFEAKFAYGEVLDEWLSGQNEMWRVIPIYGPVYQPGTPMEPGSTEPLTDKCLVPSDQMNNDPMTSFPQITAKSRFDLGATVPETIAKAKSKMLSGGAGLEATSESYLEYTELVQQAARRDVFDQSLMQIDCLAVIAGREVTIVRGLIIGKESVYSEKTLSANATVDVMSDDALKLTYDRSGGFELEDTVTHPKYYYVYNRIVPIDLPSSAKMSTRRAAIETFLRTAPKAQPVFIDTRTSDSDIDTFVRQTRQVSN